MIDTIDHNATAIVAPVHRDMTASEYHACDAVGASMLETFRSSRRNYHAYYVEKSESQPKPSAAMNLGTLCHLRILEPERFELLVAPPFPETAPDGKKWLRRKGSDHERWWADEEAKREGLILCDEEQLAIVERVRQAVLASRHAKRLLEGDGTPEYSIFWRDQTTGIDCKCRVDWMASIPLDIKTTADASPAAYSRRIVQLGYHRKLAHYIDGLSALLNEPAVMVHMAVETQAPYRVGVYEIDDRGVDGLRLGEWQRNRTLRELRECMDSGDWREPWEKQVNELKLPRWAWTENEYALEL